ncbi:MAG TPA: rod shape-determining protein MreC [Candidatus Merdibacter merdavium]|uniref:Cell shape-determining protein MreC n=1 Tax=Candidatus Merdibacter merdavium TaxID=2838692 RepID=A0A9D2NNN0_9FIRM|nr:rod shape-determining protein MreC [Candidatus Merdibacter merdavium]
MSKFTKAQKILMCLIGFFLALGLLFQGLRQSSISDIGYSAVSYLKYGLIDYPLTSIKNFSSDFANLWKVKDENDTLREELSMTTNYQALYENAQRENEELRELLNMNESLTGFNRISAKVIGRDSTYWNDQVTLNVGANDGIEEDMVVMNSQGVIGKIQKVQDSTSVVKLLTCEDKNNKVAVRINLGNNEDQSEGDSSEADQQEQDQQQERASSVEGILESYDTNEQAYVVSLLDDQEVEEGMQVVTSGKGGVYPSGLFVGTVKKVETLDNQLGQVIYVEPVSNFQYFDYVTVIEVN